MVSPPSIPGRRVPCSPGEGGGRDGGPGCGILSLPYHWCVAISLEGENPGGGGGGGDSCVPPGSLDGRGRWRFQQQEDAKRQPKLLSPKNERTLQTSTLAVRFYATRVVFRGGTLAPLGRCVFRSAENQHRRACGVSWGYSLLPLVCRSQAYLFTFFFYFCYSVVHFWYHLSCVRPPPAVEVTHFRGSFFAGLPRHRLPCCPCHAARWRCSWLPF